MNNEINYNQDKAIKFPPLLLQELGQGDVNLAINRLQPILDLINDFETDQNNISELSALEKENSSDEDLLSIITLEKEQCVESLQELTTEITDLIVQDQEVESCESALLEVIPGVGGTEAMMFASELFDMYMNYFRRSGIEFQATAYEEQSSGAIYRATGVINSGDAYRLMRHESGTHRVQRVPVTEKKGRVHTSTATVAITPKSSHKDKQLHEKDLRIDFFKSLGKGGQAKNTSMSDVKITHIPSGLTVVCGTSRNQYDNQVMAMEELTCKVQEVERQKLLNKMNNARLLYLKSRDRSDKIRTYNFHQDRITDHRIGFSINGVSSFLEADSSFQMLLEKLDDDWCYKQKEAVLLSLFEEVGIS